MPLSGQASDSWCITEMTMRIEVTVVNGSDHPQPKQICLGLLILPPRCVRTYLVGTRVGATVGTGVGIFVGTGVGLRVGTGVGLFVGAGVGTGVGRGVGAGVGCGVGAGAGLGVGAAVGAAVWRGANVGTLLPGGRTCK